MFALEQLNLRSYLSTRADLQDVEHGYIAFLEDFADDLEAIAEYLEISVFLGHNNPK